MSSAQDEAKARIEVAQLYEEMGQTAKAVRYLLAAADIYKERGEHIATRKIYQKVLTLEPGNAQVNKEIAAFQQAAVHAQQTGGQPAPAGGAPRPPQPGQPGSAPATVPTTAPGAPSPAAMGQPAAAPSAAGAPVARPQVLVPTPWLTREHKFVQEVRAQVSGPPDRAVFPYSALPPVDPVALEKKQKEREARQAEELRKSKPVTGIESAFGSGQSSFGGGGLLDAARVSGGGSRFSSGETSGSRFGGGVTPAASAQPAAVPAPEQAQPSRFGDAIAGGNRDLAEMIRRRMEQKGS